MHTYILSGSGYALVFSDPDRKRTGFGCLAGGRGECRGALEGMVVEDKLLSWR
ncbi:MAG: hypothetical protein ACLR8P_07035 [Clostridium fessum]